MLMTDKLEDANIDLNLGIKQYHKAKKVIAESLEISPEDKQEVVTIMREEMTREWVDGRSRVGRSIAFLTNKHRSGRDEDKVPDTWRDIKISNRALGKSDPPLSPYIGEEVGGVSDNIKSVMALPPKTAKFAQLKIDKI